MPPPLRRSAGCCTAAVRERFPAHVVPTLQRSYIWQQSGDVWHWHPEPSVEMVVDHFKRGAICSARDGGMIVGSSVVSSKSACVGTGIGLRVGGVRDGTCAGQPGRQLLEEWCWFLAHKRSVELGGSNDPRLILPPQVPPLMVRRLCHIPKRCNPHLCVTCS